MAVIRRESSRLQMSRRQQALQRPQKLTTIVLKQISKCKQNESDADAAAAGAAAAASAAAPGFATVFMVVSRDAAAEAAAPEAAAASV